MKEIEDALGTEVYRLLTAHNVESLSAFLKRCESNEKLKLFARELGVSSRRVANWVSRAKLYQLRGIGKEYVALFEAAKLQSLDEIAQLSPQQIQTRLQRTNRQRKLVRRIPSIRLLSESVAHANLIIRNR